MHNGLIAAMASAGALSLLALVLFLGQTWSDPVLHHDHDSPSHVVSSIKELSTRLASHAHAVDARLPLPTPQEIDAIKKVAQILVMLGEQIIPAIIGESPASSTSGTPHDPVNDR
ncbi:hypothetical protein ACJJTC_012833 [Scirpophaga incertulas]